MTPDEVRVDVSREVELATAGCIVGVVVETALIVSVETAEEFARTARDQATSTDTLAPILLHGLSGRDLAERQRAERAASAVATAFADFRRVVEEYRAAGGAS